MAARPVRSKVATAVTFALAVSAGNAWSQDDDDRAMEEIVVTGKFRASLIDSIGTKRNSSAIVEAISAEDIGKLPDSSIAEAISRLPGLAGQRLDGRQSSISIRGLGENFSTATLNGREQVSIGDNRGIEFDLYPSEIMSGVTVFKTPQASLMNQGIAGTINLHTVKPLDSPEALQVNFNLEQNGHDQLNPDGDDSGYRGTLAYIDQLANDRLGVALAVATMKSPNQEERWNSWGFPTTGDGDLVLGGAKPFVRSSTLDRDTVMGVLQFAATDALTVTADALYIDFSDEKRLRGIEMPGAWAQPTEVVSASDGLVQEGVWEDVKGQVRNDFERRDADLKTFGLNVEWQASDRWNFVFDTSWGKVNRQIWSLESYSGTGRSSDATAPNDDIAFNMQGANEGARFTPTLDYSDDALVKLGGAQAWGNGLTVPGDAQDGFINLPSVEDDLATFRLSTEFALDGNFFSELEFGIYFADRQKSKFDDGLFLTLPNYPEVQEIPDQYRLPDVSLDFIGMGQMVAYDSFAFWADGNYTEISERETVAQRWQNTWVVNEEVAIAYAMVDFESEGGLLTGNVGAQFVDTDQSSDGFATTFVDGFVDVNSVSGGASYTEVLPSLNMSFHLTDEQQVRFGAARTLSRSRMDRMNASFGFNFDPAFNNPGADISASPWSGTGANPELRPQMADQYDLTYEYYFRDDGYVAVAYFYKDLKDWQVQLSEVVDFTGIVPPGDPDTIFFHQGLVTRWENSDGGDISGWEFQGALPLGAFSDTLDGFGLVGSATFIDSSISIDGNEIKVPGLSEEIYNITAYYERGGFEGRISGSIRDDFLGEVAAISFTRELVDVKSTEIWDAQLAYHFENSNVDWLQGLTITFQAQNLTNEPFVTFQNGDPRQVRDFQDYGRNYLLGASYRFR